MYSRKSVRVVAKEAMQKFNYDPLEVLVRYAQEAGTAKDVCMRIAETLLPYMYPKLSNMSLDADISVNNSTTESQALLLQKILSDPNLADAAARLSIAAAEASLDMGIEENDRIM